MDAWSLTHTSPAARSALCTPRRHASPPPKPWRHYRPRRRRAAVYADAVTADADATDSWLDWEMDLEVLEALVSDEAGRRFLQNTGISLADRMEAVQRAVGDSMSPRD